MPWKASVMGGAAANGHRTARGIVRKLLGIRPFQVLTLVRQLAPARTSLSQYVQVLGGALARPTIGICCVPLLFDAGHPAVLNDEP